jgi:hypothetical protein
MTVMADLLAPKHRRDRAHGPAIRLGELVHRRAFPYHLNRTDLAAPAWDLPAPRVRRWRRRDRDISDQAYERSMYAQAMVVSVVLPGHDFVVVRRAPDRACDWGYGDYCHHSDCCVLCDEGLEKVLIVLGDVVLSANHGHGSL